MSEFVSQNFDLIVILIIIALILGFVKQIAGKIVSVIFAIVFILRVLGIMPNYAVIFDEIKNLAIQFVPAAGELFHNTVKMFYDFFTLIGKGTGA